MVLLAELVPRFAVGIKQEHLLLPFLQDAGMGAGARNREHLRGQEAGKLKVEKGGQDTNVGREHRGMRLQEGRGERLIARSLRPGRQEWVGF